MLLSLIGEQPIPVLLADRALRPAQHWLAYADRTRRVAENLRTLLPHAKPLLLEDAYDLVAIRKKFEDIFAPGMVFHLTGGTKPMAWAGYDVARRCGAQIVYLESEKKQSWLYRISLADERVQQTREVLPGLISLNDYLQGHGLREEAHLIPSNRQEVALKCFLETHVDECLSNLKFPAFEMDFLVRRRNQVAVIEAKSGAIRRFGIDQLTTITGREYLGTYTGRIWVVSRMPGKQLQELAQAYQIEIVPVSIRAQLPDCWQLSHESQNRLMAALDRVLGGLKIRPS